MKIDICEDFATREEAVAWHDKYFDAYHPLAYGTAMTVSKLKDNKGWRVLGYRFTNAD